MTGYRDSDSLALQDNAYHLTRTVNPHAFPHFKRELNFRSDGYYGLSKEEHAVRTRIFRNASERTSVVITTKF